MLGHITLQLFSATAVEMLDRSKCDHLLSGTHTIKQHLGKLILLWNTGAFLVINIVGRRQ